MRVRVNMTNFRGSHLIADFVKLDRKTCLNKKHWTHIFSKFAQEAGMQIINTYYHEFIPPNPSGFTAYVLLDASHFSIHTYADEGIAAVDLFACELNKDLVKDIFSRICEEFNIGDKNIADVRIFDRFSNINSV